MHYWQATDEEIRQITITMQIAEAMSIDRREDIAVNRRLRVAPINRSVDIIEVIRHPLYSPHS